VAEEPLVDENILDGILREIFDENKDLSEDLYNATNKKLSKGIDVGYGIEYKLEDVVSYRWPSGTPRPEPETLREAAKTGTGRAAAGVAAVTAAAVPAAPLITAMADLPPWTATALIVAAAIGVAAWFIAKRVR
jgi:hypothetical protein